MEQPFLTSLWLHFPYCWSTSELLQADETKIQIQMGFSSCSAGAEISPSTLENEQSVCVPVSGAHQDGPVQQAEGQTASATHRQNDGVQRRHDVSLGVVGQQGLGQLRQGGNILHCGAASCRDVQKGHIYITGSFVSVMS